MTKKAAPAKTIMKSSSAKERDDMVFNKILWLFGVAVAAELLLLLCYRFYVKSSADTIVAVYHVYDQAGLCGRRGRRGRRRMGGRCKESGKGALRRPSCRSLLSCLPIRFVHQRVLSQRNRGLVRSGSHRCHFGSHLLFIPAGVLCKLGSDRSGRPGPVAFPQGKRQRNLDAGGLCVGRDFRGHSGGLPGFVSTASAKKGSFSLGKRTVSLFPAGASYTSLFSTLFFSAAALAVMFLFGATPRITHISFWWGTCSFWLCIIP